MRKNRHAQALGSQRIVAGEGFACSEDFDLGLLQLEHVRIDSGDAVPADGDDDDIAAVGDERLSRPPELLPYAATSEGRLVAYLACRLGALGLCGAL